jgi:hypothetical protein
MLVDVQLLTNLAHKDFDFAARAHPILAIVRVKVRGA